ncbi:hypothetical protein VTI74DRAFT_644 [Chaetomium olivicolor]
MGLSQAAPTGLNVVAFKSARGAGSVFVLREADAASAASWIGSTRQVQLVVFQPLDSGTTRKYCREVHRFHLFCDPGRWIDRGRPSLCWLSHQIQTPFNTRSRPDCVSQDGAETPRERDFVTRGLLLGSTPQELVATLHGTREKSSSPPVGSSHDDRIATPWGRERRVGVDIR